MSRRDSPVCSSTWPKIGTSISTPLVVPSVRRTLGASAKPMTATSVTERPSQVVGEGVVRGARLPGRLEVADVLGGGPPLLPRLPHRAHPHAHPDIGRLAAQDQVLE